MIERLIEEDKNFNEATFKSYADNVFVKLYTAIMLKDLESIKHFLSDSLYSKYNNIIKDLTIHDFIQIYDELNVKNSEIKNIEISETEYIIKVNLEARYMDYKLNSITNQIISGDSTKRISKIYTLTFKKTRIFKHLDTIRRCPGCGASIDVNNRGICDYCGTIFDLYNYQYILDDVN